MNRAFAIVWRYTSGALTTSWEFLYELTMHLFGTLTPKAAVSDARKIVHKINELEARVSQMSQSEMIEQTEKFKQLVQENKNTLDEILPMAFAMVREASQRTLKMRHFDVQLIGGIILHRGMIAEMCTGEGKTLVATLPAYLNALSGKGVYVVTVNDYLAQRDGQVMSEVYSYLGLTTGCVTHSTQDFQKREAYHCDITYVTNNELGFDYLRDHMEMHPAGVRQRHTNSYAILDEVDSILIDEARTPLIISGPSQCSAEQCSWVDSLVKQLTHADYEVDIKHKSVAIKQSGIEKLEKILREETVISEEETLYISACADIVHSVQQSIKAHALYEKDVDYIVKDDEILLIDEFTGRTMDGRRYSDGLHQAIEAKENVEIKNENVSLASITYQNYFRMYGKLAGMTGTAATESEEFKKIYNLLVVPVPTHLPIARNDRRDLLYKNAAEKLEAICQMIKERNETGQPILVGTPSVEKSEEVSQALSALNIRHQILSARYHKQEAQVIAEAGRIGAVTIATNMAGRGTDIKLGGSDQNEKTKVIELGGLFVICTERNDSRRIDNQLRGRAGRQGDLGESVFCVSPQDRLIRLFPGADKQLEQYTEDQEDYKPSSSSMIDMVIRNFQQKIESHHFDERKHTLEYDSVLNEQRKVKDSIRETVLFANNTTVYQIAVNTIIDHIDYLMLKYEDKNQEFKDHIKSVFNCKVQWLDRDKITSSILSHALIGPDQNCDELSHGDIMTKVTDAPIYEQFTKPDTFIKRIFLQELDAKWRGHLTNMDNLKQRAYMQAYAQKDPLNVYKNDALPEFEAMMVSFRESFCTLLSRQSETDETPSAPQQDFDFDSMLQMAGADFSKIFDFMKQ